MSHLNHRFQPLFGLLMEAMATPTMIQEVMVVASTS